MKASAGNHGGRVRSDCLVELEITGSGGIELDLQSKVGALYGRSNRELVMQILGHFGIGNARLTILDSGALEFVMAARLESAIKKALPKGRQDISEREFMLPGVSSGYPVPVRDRFRFTRLYLPGNTPSMMLNAGIHNPDGIILDLEDSVAPDVKDDARILVRNALRNLDFYGAERMVRINQGDAGIRDLECILSQEPDLILLPKVEGAEEVMRAGEKAREMLPDREVLLMPILETALGIEKAYEIATATDQVVAMAIGLEDYTSDLGVQRTEKGEESLWARARMVNACKAAGIQAIDSVYSDVANETGLRETAGKSKAMGFEGMGCIHPRQIPVILDTFKPGKAELENSMRIVLAFEVALKDGLGVVSLGSKMIDPPVVKRAQRTLDLAIRLDMIGKNWRDLFDSIEE